ncbi:unnamed protein product [Durusdinium trenchii]|uniref:Uncharacterized protein n=2 Tax=Durusdinium trenchii TaxID=1381693 RepID=A0ABP0R263_9DINO
MSFKDCKSVGSGGAIHSIGQIEQWEGSTAHFTTCRSLKSGGAIFAASVQQKGDMAFEDCSAKRSGGAMSVTDATNVDLKFTRVGAGGVGKKGSPAANRRNRLSKYIKSLKSARGSVQLLGSTTFERCWAGAGGALYARQDLLLAPTARALFRDCGADAFGGALNGRDVRLLGESEFRNITALAGGVIQSTGEVIIPEETHAVMQRTSAPQISALKLINMSNLSLENTSHVWFVAPEIHLKQVKCDNGLASFKQPHHVGCVSCEENKIQVFGNPILDDDLPLKTCWSAPRGTAHVDMHHLKLKIGYMVEKANISRSFRCPNRLACMGGEISTEGFGEMCAEGYRGQGCVKCEKGYGSSDSNRFVCVACASSVWRQRMQMGRFVLEDLLLFALSVSGVASTSGEKESKILTNHFMSFVAAAGPVIQAVQETPTFKRIMSHLDVYVEGLSTSVEAGEGSGSSAAGGMSARCIQGYLNLPKNWWCRALLTLFTPFCAIAALMAMRGWRIAAVVGVNCFLPKACLCFARYLVCYRMEPEHEGGELFCAYRMYTGFSLLGLLLLVAAIACSGPVLWWRLLSDKSHSDAPYYLYLSASYKEDLKSWEVTRLVRKVFLAVICAALPVSLHPAMQIMCISLVLLTALILEMQFRPYKDSFWNLEEKTLLTVSLAMVSVTSCYLANEYHWSSTYRTQQFLLLVILVLSIVPTNVLVFQIIVQLLRERGFLKSREAA